VNVAHDPDAWQVDAGPLLIPVGPAEDASSPELDIEKLGTGYLVYNRSNYAEAIVRRAVPLPEGGQTSFYDQRRNLNCCNEVFVVR